MDYGAPQSEVVLPDQAPDGFRPMSVPEEVDLPDKPSQLEDVYKSVSFTDPQRASEVLSISNRIGEPAAFVDKNLPEIKKAVEGPSGSFFKQLDDQYPGTSKWLATPENMAVSHDDLDNLSGHEGLIKQASQDSWFWNSIKSGFQQSNIGTIAMGKHGPTDYLPEDPGLAESAIATFSQLIPDLPVMSAGASIGSATGAGVGATIGTMLLPGPGTVIGGWAGGLLGGSAGAFALPAMVKKAITEGYKDGRIKTWGDAYDVVHDIIMEGAKPGILGAFTGGTGIITGTATKALSPLAQKTAAFASEVTAFSAGGAALEGRAPTLRDFVENTILVGGMHGATKGFEHYGQYQMAKKAKEFYLALGDSAEASKIRERMPEAYKSYVDRITKDGPVENIYIPAEDFNTYFQSKGVDPAQVAQELGVVASHSEATDRGGDVKIPTSTWLEKVVGTEYYQGLSDDVKLVPKGAASEDYLTNRQTQARQKDIADRIKAEEEKQKEPPPPPELDSKEDSAKKISKDIGEQLKAAGLTAEEARLAPKLHEQFWRKMGESFGMDPYEMSKQFPMEINGPHDTSIVAPEDHVLHQMGKEEADNVIDAASRFKKEKPPIKDQFMEWASNKYGDAWLDFNDEQTKAIEAEFRKETNNPEPVYQHEIRKIGSGYWEVKYGENLKHFTSEKKAKEYVKREKEEAKLSTEEKLLRSLKARYSNEPEVESAIDKAQNPKKGPYVSNKKINGVGWVPNFAAEPTGTIGPARISKPHELKSGLETDPLKWSDMKYGATLNLIKKHAEQNVPLVINTSSDLVGADNYIAAMPKGTVVNMYLLPQETGTSFSENISRILFPGNPSRQRQMTAAKNLKNAGIEVNLIEPSVKDVIKEAGGPKEVGKKFGIKPEEAEAELTKLLAPKNGMTLVQGGKTLFQSPPPGDVKNIEPPPPSLPYHPAEGLTEEQRRVETDLAHTLSAPNAAEKYAKLPNTMGGKLLDTDRARFLSKEYAESREGRVLHTASTQGPAGEFMWQRYKELLNQPADGPAVLLAGGGGSGKSSIILKNPEEFAKADVIYDSVMPSESAARERIDLALKSGRQVDVLYVYRPVEKAAADVADRFGEIGRSIPYHRLVRDHVDSQNTFLEMAKAYSDNENVHFQAFERTEDGFKPITIEQLNALRYNSPGESANQTAKRLRPAVKERLKDVESEIEQARAASRAREETGGNQPGNEGQGQVDDGGPSGSGSQESKAGQGSDGLNQSSTIDPLGRIRFNQSAAVIDLFKSANKSTFLHESGHYFLETMGKLVAMEGAPEDLKADHQAILKWLGVESVADIKTEQHEKFARGFEAYLMEGKAPNNALRTAFKRFKDWLTNIYQHVRNLGVELTPEIRGVMDRMLSTREEIARAEREAGYSEVDLPEMSPEVAARVKDIQEQARSAAESALLKKQMDELRPEREEQYKLELQHATDVAEREVRNLPFFKAVDELTSLIDNGKTPDRLAYEYLEDKVSPNRQGHYDVAFEVTAERHGFADGEEFAKQIEMEYGRKAFETEVKSRVDVAMAKFSDLKDSAAIRIEALKAIHNDKMTELLAIEGQVLRDMIGKAEINAEATRRNRAEAAVDAKAAKDQAKAILGAKPVKEATNERGYITAERNAAVKVAKAVAAKDFEAAAEFKRQQMLNHALAAEAMRNKTEIAKAVARLSELASRGRELKDMPYGFVSQLDKLLSGHGFSEPKEQDFNTLSQIAEEMAAKGENLADIANATGLIQDGSGGWAFETLPQFVTRVRDNYYPLVVEDSVLSGRSRPYEDLSVSEFRSLRDAALAIASIGKKYERFLGDFETADINEAAKRLRESVEKIVGTPYADSLKPGYTHDSKLREAVEAIKNLPDTVAPDLVNVLTVCHYLDGGAENGPAKEFIYRPLKEAEDRKLGRYEKMTKDVNELMSKFFTPKELAEYKEKRQEHFGRFYSREQVLVMALNWGNEGNRDRIMRGFRLDENQVKSILDTLEKRDWDFAQAVWDHLETYWPQISALEMKLNGVEPMKVDRAKVSTRFGDYDGGYYPIVYDFEKSSDAFRNAEQKNVLYKQYSTAAAHTDKGHTQERVSTFNRPVRLSLDTFFTHLENVVHDLEFREPIVDINRLLSKADAKAALENSIGLRGYKQIQDWVKSVASDQGEFLSLGDKALRWFRFKSTFATLAYRVFVLPMDITGNVINGVWEIGPARMATAMKDFISSPHETKEFVVSKSERMAHRATLIDRDIRDMAKKWSGRESTLARYGFFLNAFADEVVSFPLWAEAYKNALPDHGPDKAKNIADEIVTRVVGSGSSLDQVGAQRGSEFKKATSMYYSWLSMMFNRYWLSGKLSGLEYNKGNVGGAVAIMAKATLFAWGLHSLNENFWRELFHNSPNGGDDESRKRRILSRTLQQPFGYVWLGRDAAGYIIDQALNKPGANYRMSPAEQAIETILKPFGQTASVAFSDNKEFDQKLGESAARSAGYLIGYPQQLNNLAFNFLDWMENNGELTWRDLLTRRTKK